MKAAAIGVALLVVACSTEPRLVSSNPSSVVVRHEGSHPRAAALAQAECSGYGKDARLIHTEGWLMSFDCVARSR